MTRFLNFAPNRIFVIGEGRHFKFRVLIDTKEYECIHNILLPNGMCSESRDLFTFWKADFTCCRPRRRGISCCCGSRSWTAVLLLVDVDAIVVVVVADLLSKKPGAVYPEAVANGAQKLKFEVCSGIIARDALMRVSF